MKYDMIFSKMRPIYFEVQFSSPICKYLAVTLILGI